MKTLLVMEAPNERLGSQLATGVSKSNAGEIWNGVRGVPGKVRKDYRPSATSSKQTL